MLALCLKPRSTYYAKHYALSLGVPIMLSIMP